MTQHGGAQEPHPRDRSRLGEQGDGPPLPTPGQPGTGLPEVIPPYRPQAYQGGQVPSPRQPQSKIETYLGEAVRSGAHQWAAFTRVNAGMATVRLNLRDVLQAGERMEIRLGAWMSTVRIAVPAGTEVDLQASSSMGDARLEIDRSSQGVTPSGARLVVSGWSVMSDVRVRAFAEDAKPRSGWRWVGKS